MFDRDIDISGVHANYLKDLCELAGNVPDRNEHNNFKIFKAYIDAYITCPIIGYQYNRKGTVDNSVSQSAGIMLDAISRRRQEMKYIYQILMLADEESEPDIDKRLYRAFTFSESTEEEKKFISDNMKIYNAYFLGGLEFLHEQFVEQCIDEDGYLKQMFDFVRHFDEEQDGATIKEEINRILNK